MPANGARALSAQGEKRALIGNLTMPLSPINYERRGLKVPQKQPRFGEAAPTCLMNPDGAMALKCDLSMTMAAAGTRMNEPGAPA